MRNLTGLFITGLLLTAACGTDDAADDAASGADLGAGGEAAGGAAAGGEANGGAATGGAATGGEASGGAVTGGEANGGANPPDAGPTPDAGPAALDAPGPYHVGYRQSEITYQPIGAEGPRTLRLALWYPTDDTEGRATSYLLGRIQRPEVFTDAGLAAGDAFPVLVFSHGSGGLAEQSVFFTEFFASHGFVVASPDHTGNTFQDGANVSPEMFFLRPQDITAVLDHVYDGLPDGDALKGKLNDQVVMAGHSFGGYTTLAESGTAYDVAYLDATCAGAPADQFFCGAWQSNQAVRDLFVSGFRDERIDVAIPMAPLGGPVFDFGAIDIPTLLVTAGRDETLPDPEHGDDVWAKLDGASDVRLAFPQAGHFSFANICKELPGVVRGDGCLPDNTDPDEVHRVTDAVSWAFVRRHLFDDMTHDDVLSGATSLSEAAVVTPKE
jgi:predicted dienelactone hydrolase